MKKLQQLFLLTAFGLLLSFSSFAFRGEAVLKSAGNTISNQSSVALGSAKLSLQLEGQLQRIEMKIVHNGQVKNQASYQHVNAFNANASNMARMMAKPGDQLNIKVTFADGSSKEFVLQLS